MKKGILRLGGNSKVSSIICITRLHIITPRSKCYLNLINLESREYQSPLRYVSSLRKARFVHTSISSVKKKLSRIHHSIQTSHSSQITPADPVIRAKSHRLTAASRHAQDSISSGVPPLLPLLVVVDVLELEVELFVFDELVEASDGDSGVTVIPTTAILVVVGSGVTEFGTVVVVEDVATARVIEGMVELVLVVLVLNVLATITTD